MKLQDLTEGVDYAVRTARGLDSPLTRVRLISAEPVVKATYYALDDYPVPGPAGGREVVHLYGYRPAGKTVPRTPSVVVFGVRSDGALASDGSAYVVPVSWFAMPWAEWEQTDAHRQIVQDEEARRQRHVEAARRRDAARWDVAEAGRDVFGDEWAARMVAGAPPSLRLVQLVEMAERLATMPADEAQCLLIDFARVTRASADPLDLGVR